MSKLLTRPGSSRTPLRILIALALLYYAFIAFDFLTHPFAAGANANVGAPYLFRWLSFVTGTFSLTVALFVIARVRGNIVGLLLLIYALGAVGWSGQLDWASFVLGKWITALFSLYFLALALPALIALLFYFPTGHAFPPQLDRWLPAFFACLGVFGVLITLASPVFSGVANPLYLPILEPIAFSFGVSYPLFLLGAIVSIVMRYRRSGVRERMQLKWVIWLGIVVIAISLVGKPILESAAGSEYGVKAAGMIRVVNFILWQGFAAVAFGIAILKHRLWDIDIIIRRTLVYSVLTLLLGLVYFGGVTLLQSILSAVSGSLNFIQAQSPVSIVLSTLAIAALFNPLRKRVQEFVDQRFYRRKYNAEQALASFAALARQEVDLEEISDRMIGVIEETVQPESVSLWLKPTNGR